MALINCSECHKPVSDQARTCPSCGFPLKGAGRGPVLAYPASFEYKSKLKLFGLPLIHITSGLSQDGTLKPAKGIIAIGNIALGFLAIGGLSFGVISFGGLSAGVICFGGAAIGLAAAFGGLAIGYLAVGGVAIGIYALGGLSLGIHTIYNDPEMLDIIRRLFWHSSPFLP